MPDLWVDVDTAVTVPVNILPLLDDTDFKSIEDEIAYNESGMALSWNFQTTTGTSAIVSVTPTTGGDYDWTHNGAGMYYIEIPASGGASANNDTEGVGWFTGVCDGVLPWRGPTIGFRASGLNDKLLDSAYDTARGLGGTALPGAAADAAGGLPISDGGGLDIDTMDSNVTAILGDTATDGVVVAGITSANLAKLEDILDGTGETGLTLEWIVINNSSGTGLSITGTTHGMEVVASAGPGIEVDGTTYGINVGSSAGAGFYSSGGGNGHGAHFVGAGVGSGMKVAGGLTGDGFYAVGGFTSGHGIDAQGPTDGCGIYCLGTSASDAGLLCTGVTGADDILGNLNGTVTLADDAITSAKYDESTAFPIKSTDSGSTQIARTGADSDTLETLSDQLDAVSSHDAAAVVTALKDSTAWTAGGTATYKTLMKCMYSMARGKFIKSGNTYTFYDDDDTTVVSTLTITGTQRTTS